MRGGQYVPPTPHNQRHTMGTQVISIAPDGSLHGLQHKKGKGVDLRQFGHAKIRRATLIEWQQDVQAWIVQYQEPIPGTPESIPRSWGQEMAKECGVDPEEFGGRCCEFTDQIFFEDYDNAVLFEVAIFQKLQTSGKLSR